MKRLHSVAELEQLRNTIISRRDPEKTYISICGGTGCRAYKCLNVVNALKNEAELNFIGQLCIRNDILRLLGNRLQLVEDRKRFPEIADEIIQPPLFITGLPRSGTTFLHALLSQDPANRVPQVWELMYPSDLPPLFVPSFKLGWGSSQARDPGGA